MLYWVTASVLTIFFRLIWAFPTSIHWVSSGCLTFKILTPSFSLESLCNFTFFRLTHNSLKCQKSLNLGKILNSVFIAAVLVKVGKMNLLLQYLLWDEPFLNLHNSVPWSLISLEFSPIFLSKIIAYTLSKLPNQENSEASHNQTRSNSFTDWQGYALFLSNFL